MQEPNEAEIVEEWQSVTKETPRPETTIETPRFTKKQKLIAALAGGALLAGGAFGLGLAANSGEKPAEAPANTSEPIDPVEPVEPAPIEEPVEEEPTNGETLPFSGEVLVQELTVEQMDALSIEEFAKLPYADRLAYAREKAPTLPVTTIEQDLGFTDTSSIPPYFWSIFGLAESDTTVGAKIASSTRYYTTNLQTGEIDPSYKSIVDGIKQSGGEGVMNTGTAVYVDSGEPQTGLDRLGKPIDYVNVSYYTASSVTGERTSVDKTAQAIRTRVQLLNGETVVTYPIGYTIDGKQSPVEGGTY